MAATMRSTHLKTILFTSISLLIFSVNMWAEQIKFERSKVGDNYKYNYVWVDADKNKNEFAFELPIQKVNNDFRHFKALRPSLLKMHSIRELKKAIAKIDPREGRVKLHSRFDRIEFEISGTDQDWINNQSQNLNNIYRDSLNEYLYQEYYVTFDGFNPIKNPNNILYKPDHERFVKESASTFESLVDQLNQDPSLGSPRLVTEFILSWLQNIPYNEMTSRADSNGAGYLPPIRVINQNQGDCDSKVTLMAALMKAIYPNLRIAIIYLPNHALIGVNLSHLKEDYTLDIDGISYTLAEPVGPGMIPFADIAESSKRYIESGNYKVDVFL